jgi:Tfp pilus assembly protein PilN
MTVPNPIPEIDFLPEEYRQSHRQGKWQSWRRIVTAGLALLTALGIGYQYHRQRRLAADLAVITGQYDAAMQQTTELTGLQTQLAAASAEADLYTYLRHPWPRTRILDALLAPLPEEITIEQLLVQGDSPSGAAARHSAPPRDKNAEEELKKLPASAQDLKRLQAMCDFQPTVVTLSGVTTETVAVHHYLGRLAKSPLFVKAELAGIEADSKDREPRLRFSATLTVRPGYGQPGGPAAQGSPAKPSQVSVVPESQRHESLQANTR